MIAVSQSFYLGDRVSLGEQAFDHGMLHARQEKAVACSRDRHNADNERHKETDGTNDQDNSQEIPVDLLQDVKDIGLSEEHNGYLFNCWSGF